MVLMLKYIISLHDDAERCLVCFLHKTNSNHIHRSHRLALFGIGQSNEIIFYERIMKFPKKRRMNNEEGSATREK